MRNLLTGLDLVKLDHIDSDIPYFSWDALKSNASTMRELSLHVPNSRVIPSGGCPFPSFNEIRNDFKVCGIHHGYFWSYR